MQTRNVSFVRKLLSVNGNILYLWILMGLIWKREGGFFKKRAISIWSSVKYFATCARETACDFSSRNLPLCRGKTYLTLKLYVQKNVMEQSQWELCHWWNLTFSLVWLTKYFIFHMCICNCFVWFCSKALFGFQMGESVVKRRRMEMTSDCTLSCCFIFWRSSEQPFNMVYFTPHCWPY